MRPLPTDLPDNQEILDAIPHGFLIVDQENRVVAWNRWLHKNSGLSAVDACGQLLTDLFPIAGRLQVMLRLARQDRRPLLLSQKIHRYFLPLPLPVGHLSGFTHMQQECTVTPLGKPAGHLAILLRDVTSIVVGENRMKAMQRDLDRALRRAEEANRAKSNFLSMISHDIRTPMNGIIGYTGLLLDSHLDGEQRTWTEAVQASSQMLLTLLNDVLDLSKMEAGRIDIHAHPFCLSQTVQEIVSLLKVKADEKDLPLRVSIDPGLPACVRGDAARFQQIILNLLSNAIKFTEHGCVSLRIFPAHPPTETDTGNPAGSLQLLGEVEDSGVGIHEEDQKSLFQPFSQVGDLLKKGEGSGLGLSIVKKLCELMGGSIEVQSTPGKGSIFRFSLRVEPLPPDQCHHLRDNSHSSPAILIEQSTPTSNAPAAAFSDPTASPLPPPDFRLMLVDDGSVNRKLASTLLAKKGLTLEAFSNAREAIEHLRQKPYDLVFMDVQMPGMDGFEATQAIRQGEAGEFNRNLFICAMTARAMTGDREQCLDAGMNAYLSKPLRPPDLQKILQILPALRQIRPVTDSPST